MTIDVCDFTDSYFFFEIDSKIGKAVTVTHPTGNGGTLNQARIPLECRCVVTDTVTDQSTEYILGASCKTETVNIERDIWTRPNADFCPVVSNKGDFLIIKGLVHNGEDAASHTNATSSLRHQERQVGKACDAWQKHLIDITTKKGTVLETAHDVIRACIEKRVMVSRTEFKIKGNKRVLLEYPVKTINYSQRDIYYQIDTGPVLFSDTSIKAKPFIANFRLAYIAHRAPDWAEFIVNVPTPVTEDISVDHYSKSVRVEGKNAMIKVL